MMSYWVVMSLPKSQGIHCDKTLQQHKTKLIELCQVIQGQSKQIALEHIHKSHVRARTSSKQEQQAREMETRVEII